MNYAFTIASIVALLATLRVITATHAVHALLYFIVSLLAVAVIFLLMGAPFAAALEVIIYAGAIMVLFVFVMMMLNPGPRAVQRERHWLRPRTWAGPAALSAVLAAELVFIIVSGGEEQCRCSAVIPVDIRVEIASEFRRGSVSVGVEGPWPGNILCRSER